MYGFMLFSHLTGLILWAGAIMTIVIMLILLKAQLGTADVNRLTGSIIRIFNRFAHPSAFVVLISGVVMIVQLDLGSNKPFWLDMMEKAGGTIILLFLIIAGIMGAKLKKKLTQHPNDAIALSRYLTMVIGFFIAILAVVLIVSLKL
ncbi:hypothetical protein [Paenibacillus chungangensis]|uniref:Copper resistance protein D domain-containing protein n=1 Tax=Paenibacillus chungangensis TaxID=696535 RepID=A0ABW3HTK7_9BACL